MSNTTDPFVPALSRHKFTPCKEQPVFSHANKTAFTKTWEEYIFVAEDITNTQLEVSADDNASAYFYAFPDKIAEVTPLPGDKNYGGGQFRPCNPIPVIAELKKGYYRIHIQYENVNYPGTNAAQLEVKLNGQQIVLGLIKCGVEWPEENVPLSHPITWYETRQDANLTQFKYNTGTINALTLEEYHAIARVIFAEASNIESTQEVEMQAIASAMFNRLGNSKSRSYRNAILSMLEEGEFPNNDNWLSYGGSQYNLVVNDKYCDINKTSCKKLNRAVDALDFVITHGATIQYDSFRAGGTTPKPHVSIGGTDFHTNILYKDCRTNPEG